MKTSANIIQDLRDGFLSLFPDKSPIEILEETYVQVLNMEPNLIVRLQYVMSEKLGFDRDDFYIVPVIRPDLKITGYILMYRDKIIIRRQTVKRINRYINKLLHDKSARLKLSKFLVK